MKIRQKTIISGVRPEKGETIICRGVVSRKSYLPWLSLPATVFVFFCISLLSVINGKNGLFGTIIPFLLFGLIVSIPFLQAYMRYLVMEVMVTDRRFICKSGVIAQATSEQYLNKIESCEVEQTIVGLMLNYGTVVITGTGGTSVRLRGMNSPHVLCEEIKDAVYADRDKEMYRNARI